MADRDQVPADIRRAVLVEAGHRCAIPTCRHTTTEIAHIVPWAKTRDNSFANLIALCPNCHTRFDNEEIDRKAIRMYKANLGILNCRYSDFERRLFTALARSGSEYFLLGPGGDISVANAVTDGFFEDQSVDYYGMRWVLFVSRIDPSKEDIEFPTSFTYKVTQKGREFIRRYAEGDEIA